MKTYSAGEDERRRYVKDTVVSTYVPQSAVVIAGDVGRSAPAWHRAVDGRVESV